MVVIVRAALGAAEAAGDPLDQSFLVDDQFDHMVERAVAVGEEQFERFGLVLGARKAVEDRAAAGAVEPLADQRRNDRVGYEFARFHHCLGLDPDRRALGDRLAQHVAGRQLDHAAIGLEPRRLGALARARRSQKNDVHEIPCLKAPFKRR